MSDKVSLPLGGVRGGVKLAADRPSPRPSPKEGERLVVSIFRRIDKLKFVGQFRERDMKSLTE